MAEESYTVEYVRESPLVHRFTTNASKACAEVVIDKTGIPKEDMAEDHFGARFLCVAALACFTNSMGNALVRKGANLKGMKATAIITKDKDEIMRTRFQHLLMEVEADVDEKDKPIWEAVKDDFMRGSLTTYSLENGMEVEYDLKMK